MSKNKKKFLRTKKKLFLIGNSSSVTDRLHQIVVSGFERLFTISFSKLSVVRMICLLIIFFLFPAPFFYFSNSFFYFFYLFLFQASLAFAQLVASTSNIVSKLAYQNAMKYTLRVSESEFELEWTKTVTPASPSPQLLGLLITLNC